ncbi:MAG: NAD(+) diphosphatase [Xanthomonadales bacterium]|nr:NAD(+) diphosphatase [Xanthomonadales bacterium]
MDYAFTRTGFDRCVEQREDSDALASLATAADSLWLPLRGDGCAAVGEDGQLCWHAGGHLGSSAQLPHRNDAGPIGDDWIFLGRLDGRPVFASLASTAPGDDSLRWLDLRGAATSLEAGQAGLLAYASALRVWHARHRFCGGCGGRNQIQSGGHRLYCPTCASASFPRTDPAIIVLVRDGERCLLGRQPGWPQGRYSTLAGFVEPGETLEAAVAREVHEESGVAVGDCNYLGSQPWPFPASLMVGFEACALRADIALGEELEDAQWFDPEQLASGILAGRLRPPPRLSISRWLIERWHRQMTGRDLPFRPES